MKLYPFEASNSVNWGKFAVGRLEAELAWPSALPGYEDRLLLPSIGYHPALLWVLDLQTQEGAAFRHGGHAANDLAKHRIWVCPMFEPFLTWLYCQDVSDLSRLPSYIELLPETPSALYGYRRSGPAA